jgi:hypothetical protein
MEYRQTNWWTYIDEPIQDLARQSYEMIEGLETTQEEKWKQMHDYSFIVFPIAKAYEGFLKKFFLDLGLISKRQFDGDRFRIGRSLNPFLPKRYQWDWVYPKLVAYCKGDELPAELWEVWKTARNKVFHYFPGTHASVSFDQAKKLVDDINVVMSKSLTGCRAN